MFAYVNIEFGLKYFGLLCGIILFFTGLMNLLLNVITALIADGSVTITQVQLAQVCVYALSFAFPIYLFVKKGCKVGCKHQQPHLGQHRGNRDASSSAHLDTISHTNNDDDNNNTKQSPDDGKTATL